MSARVRVIALVTVTLLVLGGAVAYGFGAYTAYSARQAAPSDVALRVAKKSATGPRIVFRNTSAGRDYGHVASVPLSNPRGTRTVTARTCDRVYATELDEMCLRIDRGVVTTFSATLYGATGSKVQSWPLPGLPSRTRISPDGKLVSSTAFVTGAAYATIGFSVATEIHSMNGRDYGNLEDFTFLLNGQKNTSADRNFWGVTFASDNNTFYATGATANHTYLVRGNLATRTLTAIHETAECPSLSPDGTHVAYKKNIGSLADVHWSLAVLDLVSGQEKILPEKRSIDDQVEWLNNSTLLYGVPRGNGGDSDVWSLAVDGRTAPHKYLSHAFSPAVIRS